MTYINSFDDDYGIRRVLECSCGCDSFSGREEVLMFEAVICDHCGIVTMFVAGEYIPDPLDYE